MSLALDKSKGLPPKSHTPYALKDAHIHTCQVRVPKEPSYQTPESKEISRELRILS